MFLAYFASGLCLYAYLILFPKFAYRHDKLSKALLSIHLAIGAHILITGAMLG